MSERPALEEVQVTEEMIDAARAALRPYYLGMDVYDLSFECLSQVYRAMGEARAKFEQPVHEI
jgi:hypothetical protein